MACNPFVDPVACVSDATSSVVGSAIDNMAQAVTDAFSKAVASLGTAWVNVGTPDLTNTGGASSVAAGSAGANADNLTTVLGYVMWISLIVAVLALIILGALLAIRQRTGDGIAAVGRLGLILGAVVLIAGASALVSGLLPKGPRGAGGAVAFLQSSLWWYMGAAAVLSTIIGGARMAWEQRAEPGRDTLRALMTLVVVAGAGVTVVNLLVVATDSFSVWILNNSLACDVTAAGGACFGDNLMNLLALTTNPAAPSLGSLLIVILGLVAVLASVVQIVLMVARAGMLVILTGVLPLSASATNTEMGRTWFKKSVAWLVAFILYKPAAAIVYATAFRLTGTPVFQDDGTGLFSVIIGLTLMVLALFALPALMRFVTPMVGALASGGGGAAMGVAGLAALPSGAAAVGRLRSGGGSGGASGAQGPSGAAGSAGSAGAKGASSAATGAAAGGSAGAAGAGAAASAGAAAGPVGVAAGVALGAAKAGAGAAKSVGEQSVGEGGGASGNR